MIIFNVYRIYLILSFTVIFNICYLYCYKIPNVKLEVLEDQFQVSIPDVPGIKFVAFNINRNRHFKSFEPGEISVQIREPSDGHWIFKSKIHLDIDDVIYIWTTVQYDKIIYKSLSQSITVKSAKNFLIGNQTDKCKISITVVNGQTTCKDKLIFQDDFETELDTNKWKHEVRFSNDNGDAEFVLYENVSFVSNGILTIPLTLWDEFYQGSATSENFVKLGDRCTGNTIYECEKQNEGRLIFPPLVAGRINTKNSFTFKYGRVEIKAKLPIGDWIVPLILLEPSKTQYGLDPYIFGQIRVAYIRSNQFLLNQDGIPIDGSILLGGAVLSKDSKLRGKSMVKIINNVHWGNDYHIFSMEWNEQNIILYIDGKMYGQIESNFSKNYERNNLNGELTAPFNQEYFVTLGLAVGGHGDFPDGSQSKNYNKPWNNTSPKAALSFLQNIYNWRPTWSSAKLEVDYVKIFAI